MKTYRLGTWATESPQVATSPFAAEFTARRLASEWAFGSVLFLTPGNVHLGVLFGVWSWDIEVWWPAGEEEIT